ncbi:GNAT family N-acetyltransferase [Clostridium swellfunianum]|uniref:GNAT family N-acetyltransferase n=1 Tax=Clostridium swellfunianum TaxID=1367462 RepID=UPI00202FB46A|nr:GNAT family N-acetyltransferase [Clostridium swellfunianum]MCM0647388.1 GNAT family N-acetyltransferase [Clostridium swellfunianum]
MDFIIKHDLTDIDFEEVCQVIHKAGLSTHAVDLTKKAFENSYLTVFVFDGDKLIGTGRAISDGVYQAGIYDIAVLPNYQGKGIGRLIMEELHKNLEGINIILYANPTAVEFYKRLGYSKMLTGMARFKNQALMREKKFIE